MIIRVSLFQSDSRQEMLTRVSLDPDRHQKLTQVTLRVLRGVNEKAQHGRRKLSAPHSSRLRQRVFIDA
jgi:hypothetical protein